MNINLNDRVEVRLTPYGKRIARNRFSRTEYRNGVLSTQVWVLMQVFGPVIGIGMHYAPFVNNEIVIVTVQP